MTIRLEDLQIICTVLGCTPNDLLVLEDLPLPAPRPAEAAPLRAVAGEAPIQRRHTGRSKPPV